MMQRKTAKTPDFYSIAASQRIAQVIDNTSDSELHVFKRKMRLFSSQHLYQF